MGDEDTKTKYAGARQINFPAWTWDYRLVNDEKYGLGLVANRNIKKGALVFSDSYEYMFVDVQDGDILRFDRHERASRRSPDDIPATFPLTRDVLTRTHGVPALTKNNDPTTAGTVSWSLEVPGMLINHSCDPNVIDDSHDYAKGEAYAARDIKRGEELTYDYTFQYYDHGPFFEDCLCGSDKCRGKMMGFKALSEEEKQRVLPFASAAIKAMHEADMATGLPVKKEQLLFPPRVPPIDNEALQLVVPGPSHANAPVLLKLIEGTTRYGLYAGKDFEPGEQVYEFWTQFWPEEGRIPVDMTFSTCLLEGDLPEGTVVRVHALECAKRDRDGRLLFSGWDLFTQHSCDPALVYNDRTEDEDDDWRGTYAARPIQKGELLTVDFNTILWDRTEWEGIGDGVCECGAISCRGRVKGFRFLEEEAQNELKSLSWQRKAPPHDGSKKRVCPGEALTPHVRVSWRAHMRSAPGVLATSSSSSDSSSSTEEN